MQLAPINHLIETMAAASGLSAAKGDVALDSEGQPVRRERQTMQGTDNPRREASGDRRREIAAAARALIVEKGFEGLRTRDIAERVGINIATLHYHVPSKEALIGLVARSMQEDFIDQSLRRPRAHLPPLTRLRMEFEDFRESLVENPDLLVLFAELNTRARRDERIDAIIRPLYDKWLQIVENILRDGIADGSFRPDLDAVGGALMMVGAFGDFPRHAPNDLALFQRLAAEFERTFVNPLAPAGVPVSTKEASNVR